MTETVRTRSRLPGVEGVTVVTDAELPRQPQRGQERRVGNLVSTPVFNPTLCANVRVIEPTSTHKLRHTRMFRIISAVTSPEV